MERTIARFAWAIIVASVAFLLVNFGFLYFVKDGASSATEAESLQTWMGAQIITTAGFVIAGVGVFFGFMNALLVRESRDQSRKGVRLTFPCGAEVAWGAKVGRLTSLASWGRR